MTTDTIAKSDQYALIARIAKNLGGGNRRFGKKALQKIVHLIQELGGVDAGYRFSFYTYGPYSIGLAGDLDVVEALNAVSVIYNSVDNYYLIGPGPENDHMIEKGKRFFDKNQAAINRVLETFEGRLAKDLELVSTVAYLRRHAPAGEFADDTKLSVRVKALKPKYTENQISKAIDEVRNFLASKEPASAQR